MKSVALWLKSVLNPFLVVITLAAILFSYQNCEQFQAGHSNHNPKILDAQTDLDQVFNEIMQTKGMGICSQDSDCEHLYFGEKMCGGPESFIIFSTAEVSKSELTALINEYNQLQRDQLNTAENHYGDCRMVQVQEPLICLENICSQTSVAL